MVKINISYIQQIFRRWRWHAKIPAVKQIQKYSSENINHYLRFVHYFHTNRRYTLGIVTIPWEKLKFLDEVHFIPKDNCKRKIFGAIGEPAIMVPNLSIKETYTMTLMTTLSDAQTPVVCDVRTETSSGHDFARFISFLITFGYLSNGDYLILDNAPVHFSHDTVVELKVLYLHYALSSSNYSMRIKYMSSSFLPTLLN